MEEVLFMSFFDMRTQTGKKAQEYDHSWKGFWPDSLWSDLRKLIQWLPGL